MNEAYNKTIQLLRPFVFMAFGGLIVFSWLRYEQGESDVEVMSIDSAQGLEIATETKETRVQYDDKIKAIPSIVDNDGYINPKFMQLMESARANAVERGDSSGIINAITRP